MKLNDPATLEPLDAWPTVAQAGANVIAAVQASGLQLGNVPEHLRHLGRPAHQEPSTLVDEEWLRSVQEELLSAVEESATPDPCPAGGGELPAGGEGEDLDGGWALMGCFGGSLIWACLVVWAVVVAVRCCVLGGHP